MRSRRSIALAVLPMILSSAGLATAQEAAQQPQISFESTELVPGLFMIEGVGGFGGGNVGLLTGDDGVVLIDDSFPPLTSTLLEAVAEITPDPIDFVVNTHVHGDHMGGNAMLGEAGATIVAHDNVRKRLVENGIQTGPGQSVPAPPEALPVVTFADRVSVHLNGHRADVLHLAKAHTDGDAIIHFPEADVIHCGDVFFSGLFPFIDLASGGSLDGYIEGQKRILELAGDETRLIPGHGPLSTRADLEASVAMLEAARDSVQALIDEGKSADEAVAAAPLAEFEAMSWQFIDSERMVRQVYAALAGADG